jgi:hypothetical protein
MGHKWSIRQSSWERVYRKPIHGDNVRRCTKILGVGAGTEQGIEVLEGTERTTRTLQAAELEVKVPA